MNSEYQKLQYQPDDKSELSAIVRWCVVLAEKSEWASVRKIAEQLLKSFPTNLSLVELFVSASVKMRDWKILVAYYESHPHSHNGSDMLAISRFDFLALTGQYEELIFHVWHCFSKGANTGFIA